MINNIYLCTLGLKFNSPLPQYLLYKKKIILSVGYCRLLIAAIGLYVCCIKKII